MTSVARARAEQAWRPLPDTITVDEAARRLGISRSAAYEAIRRDGSLAGVPTIRVGSRIVLPRARFEALVAGEASA